jgi:hypothetical protein
LGRWQRLLAADADGWLGSTAGITEDGWSITVVRFASEGQARRNSDRPEQREWWRDASQHPARVVVHDASKVHRFRQGDADTAGFVQASRAIARTWSAWPVLAATSEKPWSGKRRTSWG